MEKKTCFYCGEPIIWKYGNVWVDETDGDTCSGNDELVNENEPHAPCRKD